METCAQRLLELEPRGQASQSDGSPVQLNPTTPLIYALHLRRRGRMTRVNTQQLPHLPRHPGGVLAESLSRRRPVRTRAEWTPPQKEDALGAPGDKRQELPEPPTAPLPSPFSAPG